MKVLQYSGGMDSLAALYTLREEWDDLTVLWCNTGASYFSTQDLMKRIAKVVPHFEEVLSDVREWRQTHGYAVDVVPERHSVIGAEIMTEKPARIYTSFISCCAANIWFPLERASREMGATVIYRGQRAADKLKAPITSGYEVAGVKYVFPVENWTRDEVRAYCLQVAPEFVPSYYFDGEDSSHDCWDCIAYLNENVRRIKNLPTVEREHVLGLILQYRKTLRNELAPLEALL